MKTLGIPVNCTNLKARKLSRLLGRVYDAEMAAVGLKTTQFTLLTAVLNRGPITSGDLASRLGLEASTLTRNLRPMLSNGWVNQAVGADARSRCIEITESGRAKQAVALACWQAAQAKVNVVLGKDRVEAMHSLIDECMDLLKEIP